MEGVVSVMGRRAVLKASGHLLGELGDEQALLALAHDAVVVRAPTGEINFWNLGAEETYGWAAAEVLGRIGSDFLRTSPSTLEAVEESLLSRGMWEGELAQFRKDGSEVVVASRQVLRECARGRPDVVLEINRDITETKRAQDRLKASEERFRLMVQSVEDYAIFLLDADGFVASWNSGAERIKGYRSDEILGQHFSRFYPSRDVKAGKPAEELRQATAVGRVEDEGWRVRKDGSQFWASVVITALRDPAGVLQGFAKVTRDFTERMRFEERLVSQARLLDQVQDAVVATDEDSVLTAWNSGAQRLYGWRAHEVVGRSTLEDVIKTEFSARDREEVFCVLHEGGEWRGEVVQRHRDGRRLYVEAATIVLRHGPTRLVSVNRDIEGRNRALVIEERDRIARELHDSVSQALFAMTLQARALELAIQRECRESNDPVGNGISNIRQLTRGALVEMRSLIFELRPAALAEDGLVAALQRHAATVAVSEGLTVTVSGPSDPMTVEPVVEENLYRLAQEALSNAVKHAGARTVQIRLSRHQSGSGGIELEISDDGVGFDAGVSRPGHLGLKIMSERAANLGGTLEVTSELGKGTTVRASLPQRGYVAPPGQSARVGAIG